MRLRLINSIAILISAIFVVHALATYYGWYYTTWIDVPMHIAGGAFIGLLFFYLFTQRLAALRMDAHPLLLFMGAVGFAAFIGIGWEIYEYLMAVVQHQFPFFGDLPGLYFDTLKDLFDDVVGATVASLVYIGIARRAARG